MKIETRLLTGFFLLNLPRDNYQVFSFYPDQNLKRNQIRITCISYLSLSFKYEFANNGTRFIFFKNLINSKKVYVCNANISLSFLF